MMIRIAKLVFLVALFGGAKIFGQALTVTINPIDGVPVGGAFTVSGAVSHDAATPPIAAGTPVNISIQVLDPTGTPILVNPTIAFTGGFGTGGVFNFNQSFTMPWSEDDKWSAGANWSASVSAVSSVTSLAQGNEPFGLIIADLQILSTQNLTARAGEFVSLNGIIRNQPNVQTEPGIFFKVEASTPIVAGQTGTTGSIVFPATNSWTAGNPWPIAAGSDNGFTISNFLIPPGTPAGPFDITLTVDGPDGVPEQDDVANNTFTHTITVAPGAANLVASTDFLINGNLEGTFQGRDSVRCTVTIRNVGNGPVLAGNNFDMRVFLSNDLSVSNSDFLLREIDLGGGSIGLGLLPNETITLDWVQMLPDNFEGDFYVLSDLNGVLLNSKTTPSLSLRSENFIDLSMESDPTEMHHHARPSSSLDGMMMVHESLTNGLTRIQLLNKSSGLPPIMLTSAIGGGNPDGSSFAPEISSNGKFVVFHSHASNLVPGDTNGHVDVFRYEIFNGRLTRLSLSQSGEEGNGGSFYPTINNDGTRVAFESHASNLDPVSSAGGKQIYLWTESNNSSAGTGTITSLTQGNADSFAPSISGDGKLVAFTTFADDLVAAEADTNKDSDVVLWENGQFYYAGRAEDGALPSNGSTREAAISNDGKVLSFVSSARNMVKQKGVAHILIEDSGVGYSVGSTALITDANGTGASVTISNLNQYGEILGFTIDNPGRNYINPQLTVITPAGLPTPDRNVSAIPLLVNPEGDVFRIKIADVKTGGPSERVSESAPLDGDAGSETGGNLGSREPSISHDGNAVSYSSRASNLLDLNVTSTNTKTFANHTFRTATARSLLHWGIGSIQIVNPGAGYLGTGNLVIEDLSGSGFGAVATYQVLSNGEVGQITVVNAGSGYDLNQTTLSIQNDPAGSGFLATIGGSNATGLGANRTGGASIHRIEIIDSGTGYPEKLNQLLEAPEIIIDGDGADIDGDGKTDARLNPDRLYSGTNGEIYIEQQIDISILNRASLVGSTLMVGDLNKSLSVSFTSTPTGPFSLGVDFSNAGGTIPQTDTGLRDALVSSIRNFWGSPSSLFNGPLVENNVTAGNGFTLRALNGSVQTDNPSGILVSYKSNMLVGGSGYTRATPFVSPAPVVIGYSEIQTGVSSLVSPNGRPIFDFQEDLQTDDIYHFDQTTGRNQRVSLSKFGYPTNYLSTTTLPSHRYPSMSGDGRYVFFSSDATGLGGLIFGNSNQSALDRNQTRSVYTVDLKSGQLPKNNNDYSISISSNLLSVTGSQIYLSRPFPVMVEATSQKGFLNNVRLYVDGVQVGNNTVGVQGTRNHKTFFSWTPTRQGTHEITASVVNNIGEEIFSVPVVAEVIAPTSSTAMGNLTIRPNGAANTTQGSSLIGSVEFTGSNGKKAIVANVSFYLNDKLISTQTDPPFSSVFSPPAYDGNTSLSRWSFTALAKDLNGSTVVTSRFGQIQGSSVLPTLSLSPINTITGLSDNEIFDKQRVTLEASVQGDSTSLALVQAVRFYANGFLLDGNGTGVPITTASGQITSIEYKIDWDVDFARFAKPDGNVEIIALGEMVPVAGFTPVFPSASLVVRVSPPTPWLDEKSTALSIFSDLSESNMSTRQVEALLEKINTGDDGALQLWANDLSEVASFQQKMDVITARHICMGEWHDSFLGLETDFNGWIPTGAVNTSWLKNYIDSILNSDQYIAKYGIVPLLVGYENEKDIHDFDLNRRSFAERCLTNKYGMTPNFQQMFQGSRRMVNYWNNLSGGNYWEVNRGGGGLGAGQGQQAVLFSPPRIDSLTANSYQAGECAVDFVKKLTEEIPIDNLSYILYTDELRKSTYKIATYVQLLWRENADPVQDSDIKRLSAMATTDAIKEILNDYRYTSRFNLIWKESTVVDASIPSWKNENWFGYFWDRHFPWVYHQNLGWIYIAGVSPTQFWFYHETLGWLWTGAAHYPNAYSSNENNWIYFSKTSKAYFSHGSNTWKPF